MNDNTAKIIEELSKKFGTTAEYLWAVLLRQAPISATIQLFQTIGIVAFAIVLIILHRKFVKNDSYDRYEIYLELPMIVGVVVCFILLIACFLSFDNIINGYFNREYWALHEILKKD